MIIQTATYTLVAFTPHTIGMVRQPYRASPGMSSMSFIASRINDMIKAKPAYKKAKRNSFGCPGCSVANASAIETFEKKISRIVQEANTEIMIFPIRSFCLNVVEYNHNKITQRILPASRYHFSNTGNARAVAKTPALLKIKCQAIAQRRLITLSTTILSGLFTSSILISK